MNANNRTCGEMKTRESAPFASVPGKCGHTLVEVMISTGVLGFVLYSLYAGFAWGFAALQVSRENLRATQIMAERMEVIRLIKWDDVLTPGFIPENFVAAFDANDDTNAVGGLVYEGKVTVANAALTTEAYADNLRLVRIDLKWTSGKAERQRSMTTYISRYGKQNYLY